MRSPMLLLAFLPSLASAATLEIPGQYSTFGQAINAANDGDTIEVDGGVWPDAAITLQSGDGFSGQGLTIRGVGSTKPRIGGDGNNAVYVAGNNILVIENVELDGTLVGQNLRGFNVQQNGTVHAIDVDVHDMNSFGTGNPAGGGAVVFNGGSLTVTGGVWQNNRTGAGGGGANGGHIDAYQWGQLDIDGTVFDGGIAYWGGALRVTSNASATVRNATFTNTMANQTGAAVSVGPDATLQMFDCVIDGADSQTGGAISLFQHQSADFTDVTIRNATASEDGGGMAVESARGPLNLTRVTIEDSTAGDEGGAIWYAQPQASSASITIVDSTFSRNTANSYGGAIGIEQANTTDVLVSGSRFVDNTSSDDGGALRFFDHGNLEIVGNWFCGNRSGVGASEQGGAFDARQPGGSDISLRNNVFIDNSSTAEGGAVRVHGNANVEVLNNTFAGNASGLNGMAVHTNNSAAADIRNNIFAFHTTGGVAVRPSGSSPDPDYNLWWQNPAGELGNGFSTGPNAVMADPLFVAFSNDSDCSNDQPWLQTGSPAIGAGDPSLPNPGESVSDIGAYGGPDAQIIPDQDGDGYGVLDGDCDDTNPDVNPGALETCDGTDEDCSGIVDDNVGPVWYLDGDGDGFGDPATPQQACSAPAGHVSDNTDCDDADEDAYPGREWFKDADTDGYGTDTDTRIACAQPATYVALDGDCDDSNDAANPGQIEVCNGVDDDCALGADDGLTFVDVYRDLDGDGYGDAADSRNICNAPIPSYVSDNTDCNDTANGINPGELEDCNGVDDDCNGQADDGLTFFEQYADVDGDTYGNPLATVIDCRLLPDHVTDSQDCDDTDANVNPNATEICNTIDDDCDTLIDGADPSIDNTTQARWYLDSDTDGFGDASDYIETCAPPGGRVLNNTDCDDSDIDVFPGALEACNAIDDDCDSLIDDADPGVDVSTAPTWYLDSDDDGFGRQTDGVVACTAPADHESTNTDCDDSAASVYPGAPEVPGDGIDQDCDGADGVICDRDSDGFDGPQCAGDDCDDDVFEFNPLAAEVWYDGIDQNCDGANDWDADEDGFDSAPWGTDCDDADAAIHPDAIDIPQNSIDEDCDGLDAVIADSDGDGLTDDEETGIYGTDPFLADTDGDGLSDPDEIFTHETDPTSADTDGDGLDDADELDGGTDPNDADSDDDGLLDGAEIDLGTDPNLSDTDNDGIGDADEATYGTDPLDADTDDDGLDDGDELDLNLDPLDSDTDDDGSLDGADASPLDNGATGPGPLPPSGPDDFGCGCATGSAPPWSLAWVLAPLLLRRRR